MSFLDVAWTRLGIDPVEASIRLVDGHEFATAAAGERGPLLVAHTHANWVLSDIKLAVEGANGADPVVILHALGTDDEQVPPHDVGRSSTRPSRPTTSPRSTSRSFRSARRPGIRALPPADPDAARAVPVGHRTDPRDPHPLLSSRRPTRSSTPSRRSIPSNPATDDDLIEELGDLLFQIEFHATIAEQQGRFTIADVTQGVHDKLVRRHPHVFGPKDGDMANAGDTDTVLSNWDEIKRVEKNRTSVFDGIPRSLPSLAYAQKIGRKASKVGFDWPDVRRGISEDRRRDR